MKAVAYRDVGDLRLAEVPLPELGGPDEALVRITLAAICGSDLHIHDGQVPIDEGALIGHEFAGVVEQVGPQVRAIKAGDRVVGSFYSACGHCFHCREGRSSQCAEKATFGHGEHFGGLGGAQAEYLVVPNADFNLAPVPGSVEDEQAIFVGDILATGFFAARRAEIRPGDTVAVIGAGPVGLLAIMCAQLFGPARLFAVDSVQSRLELAEELGAEPVDLRAVNPQVEIQRRTAGLGVDAVLECVGHLAAIDTALRSVRGGGTVSSVGVPEQISGDFPYMEVWMRDLTYRAGWTNVHAQMRPLLALIEAGRLRPERIISHRMRLEQAVEAYRLFLSREATKIVLRP